MSREKDIIANQTVFEKLSQETIHYSIDLTEDLEIEDLRLLKTSFVSKFTTLPFDQNDDNYASVMEKFQIEFSNKYSYEYTFTIKYCSGTPGCCAIYQLICEKQRFGSVSNDSSEDST